MKSQIQCTEILNQWERNNKMLIVDTLKTMPILTELDGSPIQYYHQKTLTVNTEIDSTLSKNIIGM